MNISEPLISWYLRNARDLPWRHTEDPYHIWMSEIILQQTRVEQGMKYYLSFVNTYPTVNDLAQAPLDDVLKLWQGLGYYSRARNLHFTANTINNDFNGIFPASFDELKQLKGIGQYTAAAIASFAFKLPYAVVDGNVARVMARIFDIEESINSNKGIRLLQQLATEMLDTSQPDIYNQAIMELGAVVCTPKAAKCHLCPLMDQCMAYRHKTVDTRPVKLKKTKARRRLMDYLVLKQGNGLIFRKRAENDIWQGLHDFYSIEEKENLTAKDIQNHMQLHFPEVNIRDIASPSASKYIHLLTHQRIEASFWKVEIDGFIPDNSVYFEVATEHIEKIAVPRLIDKYLNDAFGHIEKN